MNVNDMIFKTEFPCVASVTLHGVIGVRDYDKKSFEEARACYIRETKYVQAKLGLSDEQLMHGTDHRIGATYRGIDTLENLLRGYAHRGICHPAMRFFPLIEKTLEEALKEKLENDCYS